ncbi:MAG: GntR family transcriptional regulator [Deltaproteobacteria bacterium]|jgi:DNA-binding GntR family transcriptional regulator|nr:GntR family transcriptional regulator [Deltaproteobacteria bacterium]
MKNPFRPDTSKILPGQREIPQYQKFAEQMRSLILDGSYTSGQRIPSEASLSKDSGLSVLTVRQGLSVLVDEGLIVRQTGRGSFVTELNWLKASFTVGGLEEWIESHDFKASMSSFRVYEAQSPVTTLLKVPPKTPLGFIQHRLMVHKDTLMLHEGYVILDPKRPLLEAELAISFLIGVVKGVQGLIKGASLEMKPHLLSDNEAQLLDLDVGAPAFSLDYVFFDAAKEPISCGSFICPSGSIKLCSRVGIPIN